MRKTTHCCFFLALLALPAVARAQVTGMITASGNDEARRRTKEIRDTRQTIDDFSSETFKNSAYLLVNLDPSENGAATLRIADKDRPKLLEVKKAEPQSETRWLVAEPDRIKLQVNFYQTRQEVACSVPKKLKGKKVLLGIFKVYENQVECFIRDAPVAT